MSGPKLSVYELSPAMRKIFYEQVEVLKQTELCMQRFQRIMKTLENQMKSLPGLVDSCGDKCNSLGQENCLLYLLEKIEEIKRVICALEAEYSSIQQRYRRDKAGAISLLPEMTKEREGKLKALQDLCEKVSQEIAEVKNLKEEALDVIESVDENLREELHSQILGGFSVDFTTIKRSTQKAVSLEIDEEKIRLEQEEKRIKFTKKIYAALDLVVELIGSEDRLSPELKKQNEQVKQLASEITSVDFLENFYSITVTPFIKKCKEFAEILDLFEAAYDRYEFLCDEAGLVAHKYECTVENIEIINSEIAKLESTDAAEYVQNYINEALESAMKEMGYSIVGTREASKKSGKKVKHELYSFGAGTGVDITYGADGQITMELGGFDSQDRVPDEAEAAKLTEDMHRFCGEFSALERILERQGVQRRNISLMPPSPEFAQIINTEEYVMAVPVQKFEAKKGSKSELKQQHAE